MAALWKKVRYKGTTPINVNFKTWYPLEIHLIPSGQIEDFVKLHGDVLEVLGDEDGTVPGEGSLPQEWPYGPMTEAPMDYVLTPGDEMTVQAVYLHSDAPLPDAVVKKQEQMENPPTAPTIQFSTTSGSLEYRTPPAPVPAAITDEKREEAVKNQAEAAARQAESWTSETTGALPQGIPAPQHVKVEEDVPPVKGEPRVGHEPGDARSARAKKSS